MQKQNNYYNLQTPHQHEEYLTQFSDYSARYKKHHYNQTTIRSYLSQSHALPTMRHKPTRNFQSTSKFSTTIFSNTHIKSMLLSHTSTFNESPTPKPIKNQLLYSSTKKSIIYIWPVITRVPHLNSYLKIEGRGTSSHKKNTQSMAQNSTYFPKLCDNLNTYTFSNDSPDYSTKKCTSTNLSASTMKILSQLNKQLCSKLSKNYCSKEKQRYSPIIINRLKLMLLGRKCQRKAAFNK